MRIQFQSFASEAFSLTKQAFTPRQEKIMVVALIALAFLVGLFMARCCWKRDENTSVTKPGNGQPPTKEAMADAEYEEMIKKREESYLPKKEEKGETDQTVVQKKKYEPYSAEWKAKFWNSYYINDNPQESLLSLGLSSFEETEEFLSRVGTQLAHLNLGWLYLNNDHFRDLFRHVPNIKSLEVIGGEITDYGVSILKYLPLTYVALINLELTDKALEHLKDMPLMHVDFSGCTRLTDRALEHLKRMPLREIAFVGCKNLTDKGLEHLQGMKLTKIDFSGCSQLTDAALISLKGMQLTKIDFSGCSRLTDAALIPLIGMPLEEVSFAGTGITEQAIRALLSRPSKL